MYGVQFILGECHLLVGNYDAMWYCFFLHCLTSLTDFNQHVYLAVTNASHYNDTRISTSLSLFLEFARYLTHGSTALK